MMRSATALVLLTASQVRRMLRDRMVVRSLMFPVALTVATLLGTVTMVALFKVPDRVSLTPAALTAEIRADLESEGFVVHEASEVEPLVASGDSLLGTDGATIWVWQQTNGALRAERVLRRHLGAAWRPEPEDTRQNAARAGDGGRVMLLFIAVLFSFYGVVFGAGGIARDRDDGTLEAEMSLPVPMWVHGTARWLAGSLIAGTWFGLATAMLDAVVGVPDPQRVVVHAIAAMTASVALGVGLIGRAGLQAGFAGPMSVGISAIAALLGLGLGSPAIGAHLPVASLVARSSELFAPPLVAVAWAVLAVGLFTSRATVT